MDYDAGIFELKNLRKINFSLNPKISHSNLIKNNNEDSLIPDYELKTVNLKIEGIDRTIFDLASKIYRKKNHKVNYTEILDEIKNGIFKSIENNETFYQYVNTNLNQNSVNKLKDILKNNNIKTEENLKINFDQFL